MQKSRLTRRQQKQAKASARLAQARAQASQRKLSEVLLEFARPLTSHLPPDAPAERWKIWLTLAATAWNTALLQEAGVDAESCFREALEKTPGVDQIDIMGLMKSLVSYRLARYPDDHRLILDVHITHDGQLRVNVTSTEASLPKPHNQVTSAT